MTFSLWVLSSFQSLGPLWAHAIVAAIGGLATVLLAAGSGPEGGSQAAEYGLSWAVVTVLLDLAVTQWFDAHIFTAWLYWLGIALVLIAPFVTYELQGSGSRSKAA